VNKYVFTVFPGNKAVTFCVIEPLHCSLFHVSHAFLVSEICAFLRGSPGRLQGVLCCCTTLLKQREGYYTLENPELSLINKACPGSR
jgi:hypothetical protein